MNHDLVDRIRRRAGRILREIVPYNQHYRPRGVQASSKLLASGGPSQVKYHEIVPARTSWLPISAAYEQVASVYEGSTHHKPKTQEPVDAAFVLELPQGRLYADNWDSIAVIAPDGQLVGDVSFQHNRKGWRLTTPEQNNIFRQRLFRAPRQLAGTVCSLLGGGGAAMGNYYHWLIDSLPRLHLAWAAGFAQRIDYYLIYNRNHRFATEMLLALGIRPEQIIAVEETPHIQAERLLVTTPVRGTGNHTPPWACEFLRQAFLPAPPDTRTFGPHVYISRRDAQMRQVLNEAEVEATLREFGFETYALGELSFAEKRALFSGARLIVSPIGAGLANLVFAPPGTPVLELMPKDFVMPEHLDIATRVGLSYHWMICESPARPAGIFEARQIDLIVDTEQLRRQVAGILAAPRAEPAPVQPQSAAPVAV
ncbi:glycosyltransferase family 61 protein [Hymenobacter chitinivorans]|uniref:Capsular polysaccharide biosynthesis protein n=1 Tax=Hymenobacter chitinivorans DSM 11115 TaxID=1121954 RepID=A0A2M9BP93_9BACT|nr:glycosyltransferase family 61 protein [Hymenobacter chitinivorans]PJJ59775.1 capsular polysaccharide biosynthesis protein [Hymenobacter chitinivorans DSM 11115]